MDRRNFIIKMAALSAVTLLPACSPSKPLTVGIHPWVGYETLYLSRDFGWLRPKVKLQSNQDASTSIENLKSGQLDAACLTLDEVLRARAAGVPLSVVLVFDVSAGADVVMTRPEIQKLKDLEGKRIAVDTNGTGALMLRRVLALAGLDITAIEIIDCCFESQLSLWRNNKADAIISYYPAASLLQREGAHKLIDSRAIPDTIIDVLAVRSDLKYTKRLTLKSLVRSHFQGLEHIQSSRQDASYRIASRQNLTLKEVGEAFAGIVLPSLEVNRSYLAPPREELLGIAKEISIMLVESRLLESEDSLVELLDSSFLPHAIGGY